MKWEIDCNEMHSNTKIKLKSKVDFNETHSNNKTKMLTNTQLKKLDAGEKIPIRVKKMRDMHVCGQTGGDCGVPFAFCGRRVRADDTSMIGNTSICIMCYETCEDNGLLDDE